MNTIPHPTTDAQLIEKSRSGDSAAYGELVGRYQSLVCSVAYSGCGDLAISEDLAQEAFTRAWLKLDSLQDVSKFKSWVCTIVRNLANRFREKTARNVSASAVPFDVIAEPASAADDPAEEVVSAELEQLVWHALAEIPEKYREPMILFYRESQSVERVADDLELSKDAVKQRLSRGRRMLQGQLAATVQTVLEGSKPAKAFSGAVVLGLSGVKTKTAAAAVASSATSTAGTAIAAGFWVQVAQLPILAWFFKIALDETRSPREREMLVRHQIVMMLTLVVWTVAVFATIPWQVTMLPPIARGLFIPGMLVLVYIPMLISFRRLGKRIERLRQEEGTDTPARSFAANTKDGRAHGAVIRYFGASVLAVAFWPAIMPFVARDWGSVAILGSSAVLISSLASCFVHRSPSTAFRCYVGSLAAIALVGTGVMFVRNNAWSDAFANHTLWFMGTMQAMSMTYAVLAVVAWRKVYGKPQKN